jgi:hypothetical protein
MFIIDIKNVLLIRNINKEYIQFFLNNINENDNNIKFTNNYNNKLTLKISTLNINFDLFLNSDKTMINDISLNPGEYINIKFLNYKTNNYLLLENVILNNFKSINLKKEIKYNINNSNLNDFIYVFPILNIDEINKKYLNIITRINNYIFILNSNKLNKYDATNKILIFNKNNKNNKDIIKFLSNILICKYMYIFNGDVLNIKLNLNNDNISMFCYEEIKNYKKIQKDKNKYKMFIENNLFNNKMDMNVVIKNKYLLKITDNIIKNKINKINNTFDIITFTDNNKDIIKINFEEKTNKYKTNKHKKSSKENIMNNLIVKDNINIVNEDLKNKEQNNIFNNLDSIYFKYINLFHKFILDIENPDREIDYTIIKKNNYENEFVCNLHINDITNFDLIYGEYIDNLLLEFNITITYCVGEILENVLNYNVNIIKIQNKGYDIGGKICFLQFLFNENIQYQYILFLHSKSNIDKRKQYFKPLIKNLNRIKITKNLLKYKNIYSIFPDIIWYDYNNNKNFTSNNKYFYNINNYNEIIDYLNITNTDKIFPEGNCFICNRIITDFIFKNNYKLFYNILNINNSFDLNWFKIYYKNQNLQINECYELYIKNNLYGNNNLLHNSNLSLPDGMIEHVFERLWINITKHLNGDFLILNEKNIIDCYNIKFNAIYFPQFHETPENNKFWGDKFTEWTLLKPYYDNINIDDINYPVLKPHDDIGYYDLDDNGVTINKQIEIAKKFNINGFIIYHYWFDDNTKILYKPLEYFLNENIDYPFCISWANETWSRRWDGTNNEILIKQKYGTNEDSYLLHINYLIQFFKKKNYMKNSKGECILYIYNFSDLLVIYNKMIKVWNNELLKHNLIIDIIITENSFKKNHNIDNFNLNKFMFEPMYSTVYNCDITNLKKLINTNIINKDNFDINYYLENNHDLKCLDKEYLYSHFENYGCYESRLFKIKDTFINQHTSIDYDNIINNYKLNKYNIHNKHLGLPLYWNNIVRRKKLSFLMVKNYTETKMEELLLLFITNMLYKYKNIYDLRTKKNYNYDNIININAWNEWNEQAVLEPNNITGYSNLETIYNIISNL